MDPVTAGLNLVSDVATGILGYFGAREAASHEQEMTEAAIAAEERRQREAYRQEQTMFRLSSSSQARMMANVMRIGAIVGGFGLLYVMLKGE